MSNILIRLDKIRARCEAATKGPWTPGVEQYHDTDALYPVIPETIPHFEEEPHFRNEDNGKQAWADAAFISAARADVPFMAYALRRLYTALYEAIEEMEISGTSDPAVIFELRETLRHMELMFGDR